jgi:membrane protease YdiL (CAAX protease family)
MITITVTFFTVVLVYPWLFCETQPPQQTTLVSALPWYIYLGFVLAPMQDIQIAIHVLALYLGSITCSLLRIYHHARTLQWMEKNGGMMLHDRNNDNHQQQQRLPLLPKLKYIYQSIYIISWRKNNLEYTYSSSSLYAKSDIINSKRHQRRWMTMRNLIIAPIVEEIIFRACLLPPLLASSYHPTTNGSVTTQRLTPTKACWIAPLFFGVAHLHHFYEKYRQQQTKRISTTNNKHEERKHDLILLRQLLIELAIQWTYTTLFGAYVSHVYIRTGSIMSVIAAHVICNYMGLPDIEFIISKKTSFLSSYKWFISFMYLVGIVLFICGFKSTTIFPTVSVLPSLLQIQ